MSESNIQKEVYRLITDEGLTPKAISKRRQTSIQAVYKIINKIKKKGLLSGGFKAYKKDRGTIKPPGGLLDDNSVKIRVHGQQYRAGIITKSQKYFIDRKKCNRLVIDGSTILLHNNSISIFVNNSFFGDSVDVALAKSSNYLNRLIWKLEDRYKLILLKSEYNNINLVKGHIAEIRNGIAKDLEKKGKRLKLRSAVDNKVWLIVDNSFNLHELETIHPDTHTDDMMALKPFLDDLRNNPAVPVRSEHYSITAEHTKQIGGVINVLATIVNPQYNSSGVDPVIKDKSLVDYFG